MRILFVISAIALGIIACAIGFEGQMPAGTIPTQDIRIVTNEINPPMATLINAEQGLHLRDKPDQAGPGDSVTLVVMRAGTTFTVTRCERYRIREWWAYGVYLDTETMVQYEGWADSEFLSPNPCELG